MIRQKGFTIVELLIVIVVIAILAAISVAVYNGVQDRTHEAAVRSDLRQMAQVMELYKKNNGAYIHDPVVRPNGPTDSEDPDPPYNNISSTIGNALIAMDQKVSTGSYSRESSNLLYISNNAGTKWVLLGIPKNGEAWYVSDVQPTPALHSSLSSEPNWFTYPGSSFSSVGRVHGIAEYESRFYNVYHQPHDTFYAWN